MQTAEYCIKEILDITDITEKVSKCRQSQPLDFHLKEPFLSISMIVSGNGITGRMVKNISQSEWVKIQQTGVFVA